jgi:hypothetical protein
MQQQSMTLFEADKRTIPNPSSRSAYQSRFFAYVSFCETHNVPIFPISAAIAALWIHDRSVKSGGAMLDGYVSGLERARRVTASIWLNEAGCDDVGARLMEYAPLADFCRSRRQQKAKDEGVRVRKGQ